MKTKLILTTILSFWANTLNNNLEENPSFLIEAVTPAGTEAMVEADTVIVSNVFRARLKLMSKEGNSRKTPFYTSFLTQIVFDDYKVAGRINLPKGSKIFRPGETGRVRIKLNSKVELRVGKVFEVRELGAKIGEGIVLEVLK